MSYLAPPLQGLHAGKQLRCSIHGCCITPAQRYSRRCNVTLPGQCSKVDPRQLVRVKLSGPGTGHWELQQPWDPNVLFDLSAGARQVAPEGA